MKMYEKYMNKELEEIKRDYESDVEAISGAWEEFRHTGNCSDISCENCPFNDDNVDCSSESIMIEKLNEELDNDDI